jgi:hypothetical protein
VATETAGSAPIVTLELAAIIRLAERVRAAPFGKHSYCEQWCEADGRG